MKTTIDTGILPSPTVTVQSDQGETPEQVAAAYLKVIEALKKK